jgi:hypothetical protein
MDDVRGVVRAPVTDFGARFDRFCESVEDARNRYGVPGVGHPLETRSPVGATAAVAAGGVPSNLQKPNPAAATAAAVPVTEAICHRLRSRRTPLIFGGPGSRGLVVCASKSTRVARGVGSEHGHGGTPVGSFTNFRGSLRNPLGFDHPELCGSTIG